MKATTPLGRIVSTRASAVKFTFAALIASAGISSGATFLTSITLTNVTGNEANLTGLVLDVYSVDSTHLLFQAINGSGDPDAAIDSIYFQDDGGLFSTIAFSAADSTGTVSYVVGGQPPNPPGAGSFNVAFSFDAASNANRVDDGEIAGFIATTNNVIGDSIDLSEFKVAYHMQSLGEGESTEGSDTYVGDGPENIPIPEPAAATLGLAGTLLLLRRRRI
jgi:hypothetical protein